MSKGTTTKSKNPRRELDAYFTNSVCARLVVDKIATFCPKPRLVLEPSCGIGSFVGAVREVYGKKPHITAVDINPRYLRPALGAGADIFWPGDFDKVALWRMQKGQDLILGNPPYTEAELHIRRSLALLRTGGYLAFILRLGFLGSLERLSLWGRRDFRYLIPFAGRPSYTGDSQTDYHEYGVFVWQKKYKGRAQILPHIIYSKQTRNSIQKKRAKCLGTPNRKKLARKKN